MKKLMMMAIMFVASAAAFAGDSDALKAILKAKTYAEAEQLLKSNLSQLADNAEKAKAYNKLVDLAYETYNDLDNKRMMQQPYDSNVMFENAYNALAAAMECDKYDQLPNAKGKVAPKFHAKNQERLNGARLTVINGGVEFANNQDNKKGYDYFLMYLNSGKSSLFADAESMKNDSNLGLASYYAGRCAILNEDYVAANAALDEALNDTAAEIRDGAFGFKLYAMNRAQKTAADSVKYLNDLKGLMAKYPDNDKVFGTLGDALLQQDKIDELITLCNQHTDNPLSIVYKGMIAMNNKQYEQAIADFANFPEDHPSYLQVVFNRAVCKLNVAGDFQDKNSNRNTGAMTPQNEAKFKELLNAAREDFEIVRGLDPDQQNVHWVVLLRNIYYNLGEDAKYQELENM
jgi:hypothetical protein